MSASGRNGENPARALISKAPVGSAAMPTVAVEPTATKMAAETKAAETKAAETKAAETKAAETKAAETKAAETKAAETRAAVATKAAVATEAAKPTTMLPKPGTPLPNSLVKRVARSYTPSEKAQALEHAAAHGVSAASDKFEISRFSIYDWQRKLKAAAGEGPSPTSGPSPQTIEEQRDRHVWLDAAADLVAPHPTDVRIDLAKRAARRIHTTFALTSSAPSCAGSGRSRSAIDGRAASVALRSSGPHAASTSRAPACLTPHTTPGRPPFRTGR